MCEGDITELSCGHNLAHIKHHCSRARASNRPCPRPTNGTHTTLTDTCATCDPAFITSSIGRSYKKRQAELSALLTSALAARRADDVGRIHDEMEDLRSRTNSAIGEAVRQRRKVSPRAAGLGVDVEFPGVGSPSSSGDRVPGYTSRWVEGKCVWEREMPVGTIPRLRRGSSAVEGAASMGVVKGSDLLSQALEAERRRQRIARGEEVEEDVAGGETKKEGEKPLWYRKFGPVQSPRVVESGMPRPDHVRNDDARPVVEVAELIPAHPLRHKRKVASWLPTEDEMDELAAHLAEEASLKPEEKRGGGSRRGRQGESKRLPHPPQRSDSNSSRVASPAGHSVRHHRDRSTASNGSYAARLRDAQMMAQQQQQQEEVDDADGEQIDIWLCEAERARR